MKVAVAGKGGSGKTTIAGTMARLLAREGRRVLAIDGDCGPSLALALGMAAERLEELPTLPADAMRVVDGRLRAVRPLDGVRRACAVPAPDGVELLVMGPADAAGSGCLSHLLGLVCLLVREAPGGDGHDCVLDMDATAENFSRGVPRHADLLLVVAEPAAASLQAAARMVALARDLGMQHIALVASKVRDTEETAAVGRVADQHGLELAGAIPFDPALAEAERAARAPLDAAPAGPAVGAIAALTRYVSQTHTGRSTVRLP